MYFIISIYFLFDQFSVVKYLAYTRLLLIIKKLLQKYPPRKKNKIWTIMFEE